MAHSSTTRPGSSIWTLVAGVILAFQGLATIVYSGFIPPPVTDAGVSVPFLGDLPFVWLAIGGVAIAAAIGVLRRRSWGRYLGTGVEILSIATAFMTNPSLPGAAFALVFPGLVLFALWRKWPTTRVGA
jgi:hypothetical protein